jgi:hypothetical protein
MTEGTDKQEFGPEEKSSGAGCSQATNKPATNRWRPILGQICGRFLRIIWTDEFWSNFVSGVLATAVVAIVGIPFALWWDSRVREHERLEREAEFLPLVFCELATNEEVLVYMGAAQGGGDAASYRPLRIPVWETATGSENLNSIKDPELFHAIATAYGSLSEVNHWMEIVRADPTPGDNSGAELIAAIGGAYHDVQYAEGTILYVGLRSSRAKPNCPNG